MPLEFGDLPPAERRGRRSAWDSIAAELKAHPQMWAVIHTAHRPESARNFAHRIRNGITASFRPIGAFEATSRGTDVWARYVGDGAS